MTFVVGCPLQGSAFLATDTRRYSLGDDHYEDATIGKLVQLRGGWGAASGLAEWIALAWDAIGDLELRNTPAIVANLTALRDSAEVRALRESPAVVADVARLTDEAGRINHAAATATVTGTLGRLLLLCRTAGGYRGAVFDDTGHVELVRQGQPFACPPPGLSLAAVREHLRAWGGPPKGWEATVQRVAEMVAWAAAQSRFMSDAVELVFMTPAGDRHLPPTRVAEVLDTTTHT